MSTWSVSLCWPCDILVIECHLNLSKVCHAVKPQTGQMIKKMNGSFDILRKMHVVLCVKGQSM